MQFDEEKKETTTATPIFPAQIHDAKAAIRWVRADAAKYNVDPDRIGVTGGSASPITHVSDDDPPVLTLHGDQDARVPVEQAKKLDEMMKAAGANHTLMVFEGQGHGFSGEFAKKAADATWAFFDEHLKR